MTKKDKGKTWLSYVNLSDQYERRARFLPSLLSIAVLLPISAALNGPLWGWLNFLVGGMGLAAVFAVGMSHMASAAGNRLQKELWPRWPYDSPTNRWLHPADRSRSVQQKKSWYAAIKRLTGLDIAAEEHAEDHSELEAVINDAVTALRYCLRNSRHADRLRVHNIDYGFARNFTGLRPVWLLFALLSCLGCWAIYILYNSGLLWAILSSAILSFSVPAAFWMLPPYVHQKAVNYAESFFGAIMELDSSSVLVQRKYDPGFIHATHV